MWASAAGRMKDAANRGGPDSHEVAGAAALAARERWELGGEPIPRHPHGRAQPCVGCLGASTLIRVEVSEDGPAFQWNTVPLGELAAEGG